MPIYLQSVAYIAPNGKKKTVSVHCLGASGVEVWEIVTSDNPTKALYRSKLPLTLQWSGNAREAPKIVEMHEPLETVMESFMVMLLGERVDAFTDLTEPIGVDAVYSGNAVADALLLSPVPRYQKLVDHKPFRKSVLMVPKSPMLLSEFRDVVFPFLEEGLVEYLRRMAQGPKTRKGKRDASERLRVSRLRRSDDGRSKKARKVR